MERTRVGRNPALGRRDRSLCGSSAGEGLARSGLDLHPNPSEGKGRSYPTCEPRLGLGAGQGLLVMLAF